MTPPTICVYCGSSPGRHPEFQTEAETLGATLAKAGCTLVYGGGGAGLMGALADGALAAGGKVVGVIPRFMVAREWLHPGLTELHVPEDMHGRKRLMADLADGFIALPGGFGTFEELLECVTWRRLGLHAKPIVVVNCRGVYDPLERMLATWVREGFVEPSPRSLWETVPDAGAAWTALRAALPPQAPAGGPNSAS